MIEGAKQLMNKKPVWIRSSIDEDGLPSIISSTDDDGQGLETPEKIERYGAQNDFAIWLRKSGRRTLRDRRPKMNCWEAVLMSAYYGGLIEKDGLIALYETTKFAENPIKELLDQLGRGNACKRNITDEPNPGDIILMDTSEHAGFHVLIAGENEMVYSHDKSDKLRTKKYNHAAFDYYISASGGSAESMVERNREHVMRYTLDAYVAANKKDLEIRYLPPSVFKRWAEKDPDSSFG